MRRLQRPVLPATLLALGLALLAAGQPWSRRTVADAAGVAWEEVRTGHDLTPVVTALLLVAAAASLLGVRLGGAAGTAVRLLTVLAAAGAALATVGASPPEPTGWFWLSAVAALVATCGALVLVPTAGAGRMSAEGPVGPVTR